MTRYLLDVNVLLALSLKTHLQHVAAAEWFHGSPGRLWATSPMTQAGLVRLLSNPGIVGAEITPQEAMARLAETMDSPSHEFWPDTLGFTEAVREPCDDLQGYRQVTDAYLLGLAFHNRGKLATFDSGIEFLQSIVAQAANVVEVIPTEPAQ